MKQSELLVLDMADMLERNGDKNMSYVDAFYEERVSKSPLMMKYLPLLKLVNFDELIAMVRYRSSKMLYDQYKTRNDNGVYTITEENKVNMINEVFLHNSNKSSKSVFARFEDNFTLRLYESIATCQFASERIRNFTW